MVVFPEPISPALRIDHRFSFSFLWILLRPLRKFGPSSSLREGPTAFTVLARGSDNPDDCSPPNDNPDQKSISHRTIEMIKCLIPRPASAAEAPPV